MASDLRNELVKSMAGAIQEKLVTPPKYQLKELDVRIARLEEALLRLNRLSRGLTVATIIVLVMLLYIILNLKFF